MNNKAADQPGQMSSLIRAFIFCLLESIMSRLASSEISIFQLVSVAEQANLNLTLLKTPRQVFSRQGLYNMKL